MSVTMNYPRKNAWRRRTWKRIRERLTIPTDVATVVYLPGPMDIDGRIAEKEGFKRKNFIPIERSRKTINKLKSCFGLPYLKDTLSTQLTTWPVKDQLDVVHLDFYGGLSLESYNCLRGIAARWRYDRVVSINMYRSRGNTLFSDPGVQHIREGYLAVGTKHVAVVAVVALYSEILASIHGDGAGSFNTESVSRDWWAKTDQYKTRTGHWFDSCVFRIPMGVGPVVKNIPAVQVMTTEEEARAAKPRDEFLESRRFIGGK